MFKYVKGFLINLLNPGVSIFAKVDSNSKISHKSRVYGWTQVSNSFIDDYSYVGRNSRIIHASIGKFCSIASDTILGMGTHTLDKLSTSSIFTEARNGTRHSWVKSSMVNPYNRVIVGNDVWIGTRAMVVGGVRIGDGAVVGAGAIVTKDIPPFAVVVGVPAKVVRFRFSQEQIDAIMKHPWWELPDNKLRDNISLFQTSSIEEVIDKLNNA